MSHFDCSRCTVPHEHDHLSGETTTTISISMLCFELFGIYWYHPQVLHERCNDIKVFVSGNFYEAPQIARRTVTFISF